MTSTTTVYDIITDRIIKQLEAGVVPWRRPWKAHRPTNLVSGKPYQGINFLLLADAPFSSPYWVTFNQARDLGGHVKKGAKGSPVFFWKVYEGKAKGEGSDGPDSEATERRFVGRYYTVFNVEQCEGLEVPTLAPRTAEPIAAAQAIADGYQGGPTLRHAGDRAYYSPLGDHVQMPPREAFTSPEAYYGTLFHELTHSTGHVSRLARFTPDRAPAQFGSEDYSKEELIAEMGAAFLCAEAGISNETIGQSAAYIRSWLNVLRSDKKAVVFAAAAARKAAAVVLGTKNGPEER